MLGGGPLDPAADVVAAGAIIIGVYEAGKIILSSNAAAPGSNATSGGAAPPPNDGDGGKHGRDGHDDAIRGRVKELKDDPNVRNLRMNQQQADVNGARVGTNRPDLQFDRFNRDTSQWEHHNVEWDYNSRQSAYHQEVLPRNDPHAINEFNMLK